MIQIISMQRTGGSSLYMCLLETYGAGWKPFNYEPIEKILKKNHMGEESNRSILKIMKKFNFKEKIEARENIDIASKRLKLSPVKNIDNKDVELIISYLNFLKEENNIAQKTFGFENMSEYFIKNGMYPVFCSRYLDQYLSSHIRLGLNPYVILSECPNILNKNHDELLQNVIDEMRKSPIFSYEMGVIDQFPACCQWLIHSYYCIKSSLELNIPVVWTGDKSTKGKELCEYIRKYLGKENGESGFLEDNLMKKTYPSRAKEKIINECSWNLFPTEKTKAIKDSIPFIDNIKNILEKFNGEIITELKNRIDCEENNE